MSRSDILTWLGWACYAGGVAAIVAYIVHFASRQGWRRPWNAAGLVLTAIGLTQLPLFLHDGAEHSGFLSAVLCIVCLLAGAALQAMMTLRTRKRGADDRRAPPEPEKA